MYKRIFENVNGNPSKWLLFNLFNIIGKIKNFNIEVINLIFLHIVPCEKVE